MKVVVGIDESGLGPTLGPLCFGFAAFRTPDGSRGLFHRCSRFVTKDPSEATDRIAIDDSKRLYAGRQNLAALELAALAAHAPGTPTATALEQLAGGDASGWPVWYAQQREVLPIAAEATLIERWRARWCEELDRVRVTPLACFVRPVLEGEFNGILRSGLNKAQAVLARVGPLLARAAALDPQADVEIRVDRLGGRKFYAPLLRSVFPLRPLTVLQETEALSCYELRDGARRIRVSFEVEGDGRHLEIALASVVAKYVRELFVNRLNRHFAPRRPGVRPTAGYPLDAQRWLDEFGDALTSDERSGLVRLR